MARRASSLRPILCAVLDGAALGSDPRAYAQALFEAGVDWIQLRDRALESGALLGLARALIAARNAARDGARAAARGANRRAGGVDAPRVLVNKRVDVALAAGADGVHLGMDAVDPASARALFESMPPGATAGDGPGLAEAALIGASIHAVSELAAALAEESSIDYVHLAPIWSPRSKPAERPEQGVAALGRAARIAAETGVLVIAQGGLDATRAAEALAAGAAGIAVTGIVSQATDPQAAVRGLRDALDRQGLCDPRVEPVR
jgi:thiamine-phosphate pyrophosphorylase